MVNPTSMDYEKTVILKACCKITVDLLKNLKSFTTYSESLKKSIFLTGEKNAQSAGEVILK